MARDAVLLGPQRFDPSVVRVLDDVGVEGTVAVVTAGWQERESEDEELREHIGRELVNLRLYERLESVLGRDRTLAAELRERQARLQEAQRLYRRRLAHLLAAARELMALDPKEHPFLLEHRTEAIRAVRTLDRQHIRRVRRIHREHEERVATGERPAVAWHRAQLRSELEGCRALLIAGGHVAVLLNRLRVFDVLPLVADRPLVAWSAGAMVLTSRIVLFHDSPPQGMGDPEVLDAGLDVCPGVIALPHADRRLRLDDPVRVSLFARRFAPALCVVLDRRARLARVDGQWKAGPETRRLHRRGAVRDMATA